MTPVQYYFPYFFKLEEFNKSLEPFGLLSYIDNDPIAKMPKELVIAKNSLLNFFYGPKPIISLPFHATVILTEGLLIYWETDYDCIIITIVDLNEPEMPRKLTEIDLSILKIGSNQIQSLPNLNGIVTFVRSNRVKYDLEYYERFLIVIINAGCIELIPFDWFNKTGGDFGYVWPAICQFDFKTRKLYGKGMRLSDFVIELV